MVLTKKRKEAETIVSPAVEKAAEPKKKKAKTAEKSKKKKVKADKKKKKKKKKKDKKAIAKKKKVKNPMVFTSTLTERSSKGRVDLEGYLARMTKGKYETFKSIVTLYMSYPVVAQDGDDAVANKQELDLDGYAAKLLRTKLKTIMRQNVDGSSTYETVPATGLREKTRSEYKRGLCDETIIIEFWNSKATSNLERKVVTSLAEHLTSVKMSRELKKVLSTLRKIGFLSKKLSGYHAFSKSPAMVALKNQLKKDLKDANAGLDTGALNTLFLRELIQLTSKSWKELSDAKKKSFKDIAAKQSKGDDKKAIAAYRQKAQERKSKRQNSEYHNFIKEKTKEYRKNHPDENPKQVLSGVAVMWRNREQ